MKQKITFTKLRHFFGHKDAVYSFCYDAKKKVTYSAGADGYIVSWDILKNEDGELLLQASEAFYCCYFCDDTDRLIAGSRSGVLYVIDIKDRRLLTQEKISDKPLYFITSFYGHYYCGDESGKLHILSKKFTHKGTIQLSNKSLRSVDVQDQFLAIGSSDNNIYLLNVNNEIVQQMIGHSNSVFAVHFLSKEILASTGRDALIKIWDTITGKQLLSTPAHMYQAKSLDSNSKYILSCSMDKSIKLWDTDLNLLKVVSPEKMSMHTNCINKVLWIDEHHFLSSSDDKSLILWKLTAE
jgi:WD40 repeat protein